MEGSSVNYENDYYRILKFINKSKFTFTDVDNENNKGLLRRCNSKHKNALRVSLNPSDIFHGSLTHRNMRLNVMTKMSTPLTVLLLIVYT